MKIIYQLYGAGTLFVFQDERALFKFIDTLLRHAAHPREVYVHFVVGTNERMLDHCLRGSESEELLNMIATLKLIQSQYGLLFDPEGNLFRIEDRPNLH